jgi:hypothetical protein
MITSNRTRRDPARWVALTSLGLLLPALMGGCPEFRNDLVGTFETVTQSLLIAGQDPPTVIDAARDSILNAALNLFFDQLRSDDLR